MQLVVVCTEPTFGRHTAVAENMTRLLKGSVSGVTRLSEYSGCVAGQLHVKQEVLEESEE